MALFGAVVGTGAVIYDYHKALQFVGIFGLLITAVWRYNSIKVGSLVASDAVLTIFSASRLFNAMLF